MPDRPTGMVTFLFTDIEGSTRLWEAQPEAMREALLRHDAMLREAITGAGGEVFQTAGDAFSAAFASAPAAAQAALAAQYALQTAAWGPTGPLRVRMALHSGPAEIRGHEYHGPPTLNRLARLLSVAHGDQILLTSVAEALVREALPPGATLLDLGERRLRDLIRSEHIYQLIAPGLRADFPPLRTLDTRPNNLPAEPTALIGRDPEIAAATALLRRPDVRLVTFSGPGGTGKTRLSLQVAAELLDQFEHGVWFVPLATITNPDLLAATIGAALGLREEAGRTPGESLQDYLRSRQMLLVLDNFEQVMTGAERVATLLAGASRLKILVTSRAVLRLYGEYEFPVPPLTLPDPQHLPAPAALAAYPAVELFVQRAQAVRAGFALTAENAGAVATICARLDGLPLAIELAAARTKLLSPMALLARLQPAAGGAEGPALQLLTGSAADRPMRQQTLRGAIEWSYHLLDPGEQALFRRLAVFVGGCTLEAAATVTGGAEPAPALSSEDGLVSLVDKSLLRQSDDPDGEPRFTMLQTIREYALERLAATGEADPIRHAHARHYLIFAERAEPYLGGPEQVAWLDRLERDHDNMAAAFTWLYEQGADEYGVRLVGTLWRFWYARGYLSEGRRCLELALARGDAVPAPLRARALDGAGVLTYNQGDYNRAKDFFTESLALQRGLGDKAGVAYTLSRLGAVLQYQGDYPVAAAFQEESLDLFRELGDKRGIATTLNNLGTIAQAEGDYERAAVLHQENLAVRREIGDKRGVAITLNNVGVVALYQEDYAAAARHCRESLALFRELGDKQGQAAALTNLSRAALYQGDAPQAAAHGLESLVLLRELGDKEGLAECLEVLAGAAGALDQPRRAAHLFGAAEALRESIGAPLVPADHVGYVQTMLAARAHSDRAAWHAAWLAGRALDVDQAVATALRLSE